MAYDITGAFEDIELSLIKSMRRNMQRHIKEEYDEGLNWTQWQAEMLNGLSQYRAENATALKGYMGKINAEIDAAIRDAYLTGESEQEIEVLKAIKAGYKAPRKGRPDMSGRFFRTNEKKLNALINATVKDMQKAETALLRMTDDVYRKTIFKAQMFYNNGAGNMWQCVDMSTKDFLNAGINCVQYKNGARVNIASYAEMSLRTANKRANLMGQANTREKWGMHTVKVNARGIACPMCLQWLDKVYIDDVYGGGTAAESAKTGYPLLSTAVAGGLYHPNCKDSCSTFYPGISREPQEITKEQEKETLRRYNLEQKQRYYERNYKRNMRLGNGCLDQDNAKVYFERADACKQNLIQLCEDNPDVLRLDKARLSLRGVLCVDNAGRISVPKNTPAVKGSMARNYNCDIATKLGKAHYDASHDLIDKCQDAEVVEMWKKHEDQIKVASTTTGDAYCSGKNIYLDIAQEAKGDSISAPYQTLFHEGGHAIDNISRSKANNTGLFVRHFSGAYKGGLFPQTIESEVMKLVDAKDKELKALFKQHAGDVEWFRANKYIGDWEYEAYKKGIYPASRVIPRYSKSYAYKGISNMLRREDHLNIANVCDIFEGATNARVHCVAGHGKTYWTDRTVGGIKDGLAAEAFAEMTDATIANKGALEAIKKYLPKSYKLYKEMVKEILK